MQKYLRLTFKYTNSKFIYLCLMVLVPSVLLTFLISPSSTVDFICHYSQMDVSSFLSIYLYLIGTNVRYIYLGVIGLIAFAFVLSVCFGAIYRHMLTGEFDLSLNHVKNRLNYNFLTALKAIILIGVAFEVFTLLNAAEFFLWASLFSHNAAFGLSIASLSVNFIIALLYFSITILWTPIMMNSGYKSAHAFSKAIEMIRGNNFKVALPLGLTVLVPTFFMIIFSALNLNIGGVSLLRVADSFCYLFIAIFYIVLTYTVYFDLTGLPRADLNNTFIWSKNK